MYSQKVLDHFHHPCNVGEIAEATAVVEASNPVCGDLMKLWVIIRDGKIQEAKFKVQGCVPSVACASWLTDAVTGRSLEEALALTADQIIVGLEGLPAASRHAAVLAIDALQCLAGQISKTA